jgi:cation-transporting P-type ATPase E
MTIPLQGLTSDQVKELRDRGLGNNAHLSTSRSYVQILRENVFTFINNVLFILGLALILMGRPSDALVSVGVILINVLVSLVQEIRAKRTLDKIALLTRPTALVIRDGQEMTIDPGEIVVGDLLKVGPGDQIVVDGSLVSGSIDADESLITGESDLIRKQPGSPVYSGSFCVNGAAYFTAEKVGADSLANQITAGAKAFRRVRTPIQKETNLIVRVVLIIAVYFELLLLVNTLLNDIPIVDSVKMSIVIAGLVPNGLFVSIAVAYALGAVRIAGKGALVQQSNSVESLSNVNVLCLDKTGTLTANRILYNDMALLCGELEEFRSILGDFAASTTTSNRTNEAIAAAFPCKKLEIAAEIPFSSERKWSALCFDLPQRRGTFVLGAPEVLSAHLAPGSDLGPRAAEWTETGLRVVLLAHRPDPVDLTDGDGQPVLPENLIPLGLISFSDELRPEARETLAAFTKAGVKVKIISGDNPGTVAALASQAGMGPNLKSISGLELAQMEDAQFDAAAQECTIFGRITPQQKERLVHALRRSGNYVAMIGDGVNDVLSLKQANLGIAMQSGSQATRGVADLVLLGDSFAVLPYAVREGQRIVNGMQDILKLYITRMIYTILLVVSTGIITGFPFSPKHSSMVALLSVGLPTLALAAWARPARVPRVSLIRRLMHFVLPAALTQSLFGLGVYLAYLVPSYQSLIDTGPDVPNTNAIFSQSLLYGQTALAIFSIFCGLLLVVFVEPPSKWWEGGDIFSGDRRPALLSLGLLIAFIAFLFLPGARNFFDFSPMHFYDYFIIGGVALVWAFLVRAVWRSHLLDRFLEVKLDEV